MKTFVLMTSVLFSFFASARPLEDVKILDLTFSKESFEAKLQTPAQAKTNAYFTVEIGKDDEKALEKIAQLLTKQKKKSGVKLTIEILSFSEFPSGSHYRSNSVFIKTAVSKDSLLP